jgi:hypothetical protein
LNAKIGNKKESNSHSSLRVRGGENLRSKEEIDVEESKQGKNEFLVV